MKRNDHWHFNKKVLNTQNVEKQIIAPFNFNPSLPNINYILRKHHKALLFSFSELTYIFKSPPMAAYRQPKNIKSFLCKSNLSKIKPNIKLNRRTHSDAPGWKKCQKSCHICPLTLPPSKVLIGQVTGYKHVITEPSCCSTENCIYYWRCVKPNCKDYPENEYVGRTKRKFSQRLGEHRDYIKTDRISEPSGEHFTKPGHSVHDLRGQVLEKVHSSDPFVLKVRESFYINKFGTFRHGLNKE